LTDFPYSFTGKLSSKVPIKQPLKILPEILLRCVISGALSDYHPAVSRFLLLIDAHRACSCAGDRRCLIMRHETSAHYTRSQNPLS